MSRFGGLLMGALGDSFTNVANEHRAEDKQIRQEARAMDAYRGKKDIDTEYARAEETRQQEISVARQKQIINAYNQMPEDVKQSPMAVADYFASHGMTDYAKDFLTLMKTSAETGAAGALERQREASAANDYSQISDRQRKGLLDREPESIRETRAYLAMSPELREAHDRRTSGSRSSGATSLQKDAQWLVDQGLASNIGEAVERIRSDPSESTVRTLTAQILSDPRNMQMTAAQARKIALDIVAEEQGKQGSAPSGPTVSMGNFPIKPDVK